MEKGFLKIIHGFPYSPSASLEEKREVIARTLRQVKENGYDGIVGNVDWNEKYPQDDEQWILMREKASLCRELRLRLWIYDEKGYPSGAAGTRTLKQYPETEAQALAAVYHILPPKQSVTLSLPYGHLRSVGAFGFYFDGDLVSREALRQEPISIPLSAEGYRFENHSGRSLLCLAFFTKRAFEGTHGQHNAFSQRRYIDIAHPMAGRTFIENTYAPYTAVLREFIQDGTVEAFFTDEPSYMAVYFNLQKQCPHITHEIDEALPLWAMVSWSEHLPERFHKAYGYRIEERLPYLFLGNEEEHQALRRDFYLLLSKLAEESFFKPLASFCKANHVCLSGHILLEEKLCDHPLYEGNFFSLLRHMQIPGMDMLDSLPEPIRSKAFTPLLVKSISSLYSDGQVMDEVSSHFQEKFGVPVSPLQLFCALALQYALGASIFTSYYGDEELLQETSGGETVLAAFKRLLHAVNAEGLPSIALYYPIEAIMAHTVSPVDLAHVYDSSRRHGYRIPYPIDRADLEGAQEFSPLIDNPDAALALQIEANVEQCMNTLLDHQLPFLFFDTDSIELLMKSKPKILILPAHKPSAQLLKKLSRLIEDGCLVIAMTACAQQEQSYASLSREIVLLQTLAQLAVCLNEHADIQTEGETERVVALWGTDKVLLINCEDTEKRFVLKREALSATDCYSRAPVDFDTMPSTTSLTLGPYGVVLLQIR